jgi:hypothetical protein
VAGSCRKLARAAAFSGRTVSEFVLAHVEVAAQKVIDEHEKLHLDQTQSKILVDALLAPKKPKKEVEAGRGGLLQAGRKPMKDYVASEWQARSRQALSLSIPKVRLPRVFIRSSGLSCYRNYLTGCFFQCRLLRSLDDQSIQPARCRHVARRCATLIQRGGTSQRLIVAGN